MIFLPALAGVYLRGREDSVAQSAQLLRQDFGAHRNVVGAAAQLNVAQQIVFLRNDFVERVLPDGRVANAGEVLEVDQPRRIAITWRGEIPPEPKAR